MAQTKTLSIFGFGNFGTLFACMMREHFDVHVYAHKDCEELKTKATKCKVKLSDFDTCAACDIVILAVPISKTEDLIRQIAPIMKAGALLIDTCSVKVLPCEWLKASGRDDIQILGTHPMFGPTTSRFDLEKQEWQLKDLQMVLCPLRIEEKLLDELSGLFSSLGLKLITTTPEDHDRQNAKTLSFVHFIGRSLLASGIGQQEIFTPGYADLLRILPHTTSDNWQLFYDMNNYNPFARELREKFWDASLELEEKIMANQDKDELLKSRDMIDTIDGRLMKLIEARNKVVQNIGQIKKERGIVLVDAKREGEIIEEKKSTSKLDAAFVEDFYKLLFRESYKLQ